MAGTGWRSLIVNPPFSNESRLFGPRLASHRDAEPRDAWEKGKFRRARLHNLHIRIVGKTKGRSGLAPLRSELFALNQSTRWFFKPGCFLGGYDDLL